MAGLRQIFKAENQKKIIAVFLAAALLLALVACGILYRIYCVPTRFDPGRLRPDTEGTVLFSVDTDMLEEGSHTLGFSHIGAEKGIIVRYTGYDEAYLTFSGWALIEGKHISIPAAAFVLHDEARDTWYTLYTTAVLDDTQTESFGGGWDYNRSGMYAAARKGFLREGQPYALYIAYETDGNNLLVDTGIRLTRNGEVVAWSE